MAIDYQERLTKISAAIDAILLGGQDVQYDGKRVTRAELGKLQELEKNYEGRITRQLRGGIRVRGGVPD